MLGKSAWFGTHMPFGAYNLRHCYARRCWEFKIAPDGAAKLMGHTLQIHLQTYRAWVSEQVYLDLANEAIQQANRPAPL